MEPQEWDYNELVSSLAKQMGVELEDDDIEDECQNHFVGVKSADVYFGGRKLPNNPAIKVYCNGPIGDINIDFNHNY